MRAGGARLTMGRHLSLAEAVYAAFRPVLFATDICRILEFQLPFAEKHGWRYLKCLGNPEDCLQARIPFAAFDATDIGSVKFYCKGKAFLRVAPRLAQFAQALPEIPDCEPAFHTAVAQKRGLIVHGLIVSFAWVSY